MKPDPKPGRPGRARTRAPRRPGRKARRSGERGQAPGQAPAPAVSDGLEDAPIICDGLHLGPLVLGPAVELADTIAIVESCGTCGLELAVVSWRRDAYKPRPQP